MPAPRPSPDDDITKLDLDDAVAKELVALYGRQSLRTGPFIALVALLIATAAWPRAPHWMVVAWVAAEWLMLGLRHVGMRSLRQNTGSVHRQLRIAQLLRGLHALSNAGAVMFFPYLSDLGKTMVTLIIAGLTTGAIGTSGGYLPVYLAYAGPAMLALILGWSFTPIRGDDQWMARAMVPLLLMFALVMVGLARDNFKAFKKAIGKRLEEARLNVDLRLALAQAEAANSAKTRFLASASHDLRQPLHSLSLFFATLRLQVQSRDNRALLDHIDQALSALQSQMNVLLDMSKLDAGMVTASWQSFALRPLLDQLYVAYTPVAVQKGLILTIDSTAGLMVHSDPAQLMRVLRNLMDNAMKYTNQGRIHLKAARGAEGIEVRIEDTGCGIAPAHQADVFEEFFQVDNPERDRNRGLGLGLSIVRRLSELLALRIALYSVEGEGTTVTLTIPEASDAPPPPIPEPHGVDTGASIPICHVLVVDDEAEVRAGMAALLGRMGCEVMLASSTEEALRCAALCPPDIVLADLRLRGQENGIEVVESLKRHHPHLAAIIITGDTAADRLRQVRDAGLPLLHKPVSADALMAAIAQGLDSAN